MYQKALVLIALMTLPYGITTPIDRGSNPYVSEGVSIDCFDDSPLWDHDPD